MADNEVKNYFSFLDIPDGSGGTERWHAKDAEAQAAIQVIEREIEELDPASVENKANKVASATSGHLAGLNGNGDLTDSGKAPTDFAPASHASDTDIHVTTSNKTAWNAKYDKPSGGIPDTDLTSAVQTSLGKADSAYQKPSGGIPDTDLTSGVQTSLGKADSAYQKPSGGIPKTDLAEVVQTSLGKADTAIQSNPVMTGATASVAGAAGLVPAPAAGDNVKFLRGDGSWSDDLPRASFVGTTLVFSSGGVFSGSTLLLG